MPPRAFPFYAFFAALVAAAFFGAAFCAAVLDVRAEMLPENGCRSLGGCYRLLKSCYPLLENCY